MEMGPKKALVHWVTIIVKSAWILCRSQQRLNGDQEGCVWK